MIITKSADSFNFDRLRAYEEKKEKGFVADSAPICFKAFPITLKDHNPEKRSFRAVASAASQDRAGDTLQSAGCQAQNYMRNPVLLWAHQHLMPAIGHVLSLSITSDRVEFEPCFATKDENPLADQIYLSYLAGHLNAFSVGFQPLQYTAIRDEEGWVTGYDIQTWEMMENSACNVPMHQDALTMREMGEADVKITSSFDEKAEAIMVEMSNLRVSVEEMKQKWQERYKGNVAEPTILETTSALAEAMAASHKATEALKEFGISDMIDAATEDLIEIVEDDTLEIADENESEIIEIVEEAEVVA
ncbi:MAG: hypothetical protein AB2L14_25345 [Candidatus Xenobiia bacterium LiM19]